MQENIKDLISVIIPVYNVAEYLSKCLDSIVNQTYKNLQIIIVNDGSTDSSLSICRDYESKDRRITVVDKPNGGLSSARNAGLDIAEGEWVAFLDSDDWVSASMYEDLLSVGKEYNASIVSCKTHECPLGGQPAPFSDTNKISVLNLDEMLTGLLYQKDVRFEVWNKLWKRNLIGDTRFIDGQVSEDVHFDRLLFVRAKKMVVIDKTLHHYLTKRPGSTLSSFKIKRMCVFEEFKDLLIDIQEICSENTSSAVASLAGGFAKAMYVEAYKNNVIHEVKKQIVEWYRYFYPLYKNTQFENYKQDLIFRLSPALFSVLMCIKLNFIKHNKSDEK